MVSSIFETFAVFTFLFSSKVKSTFQWFTRKGQRAPNFYPVNILPPPNLKQIKVVEFLFLNIPGIGAYVATVIGGFLRGLRTSRVIL